MTSSRRRGMTALGLVLAASLVLATWLTAGAATTDPLGRDVRRAAARAQALLLAEAGVEAALADARRGSPPTSLAGLRVGDGTVDVVVRPDGDEVEVRAVGRVPAPGLLGPGGRLGAALVVRLRGAQVVSWEEVQ